jgi:hypothetical protein
MTIAAMAHAATSAAGTWMLDGCWLTSPSPASAADSGCRLLLLLLLFILLLHLLLTLPAPLLAGM